MITIECPTSWMCKNGGRLLGGKHNCKVCNATVEAKKYGFQLVDSQSKYVPDVARARWCSMVEGLRS